MIDRPGRRCYLTSVIVRRGRASVRPPATGPRIIGRSATCRCPARLYHCRRSGHSSRSFLWRHSTKTRMPPNEPTSTSTPAPRPNRADDGRRPLHGRPADDPRIAGRRPIAGRADRDGLALADRDAAPETRELRSYDRRSATDDEPRDAGSQTPPPRPAARQTAPRPVMRPVASNGNVRHPSLKSRRHRPEPSRLQPSWTSRSCGDRPKVRDASPRVRCRTAGTPAASPSNPSSSRWSTRSKPTPRTQRARSRGRTQAVRPGETEPTGRPRHDIAFVSFDRWVHTVACPSHDRWHVVPTSSVRSSREAVELGRGSHHSARRLLQRRRPSRVDSSLPCQGEARVYDRARRPRRSRRSDDRRRRHPAGLACARRSAS